MNLKYATFLLNKNTEDYNRIAISYDEKRNFIPKDFLYIQKFINENEKILDLGCGTGKFAELVNSNSYLGADISLNQIEIAQKKYPNYRFVKLDDPLKFPFEKNSFDKVLCLSTLHHIPSKEFRYQFIQEVKRILKDKGILIFTVWNLKDDNKAKRLLNINRLKKIFFISKLDFNDIFYPWKNSKGEIMAQRYVHIFSMEELRKILKLNGLCIIEEKIINRSEKGSNIIIVSQKHS